MSDFSEGVPSTGGGNMGRVSSMQRYSGGGGGGAGAETELSFGVESNVLQALTGEDPKGGSLASILTFGVNSVSGIAFDFGLFSVTHQVASAFSLPTGPNIGLPNLHFGLAKGGGKGGGR